MEFVFYRKLGHATMPVRWSLVFKFIAALGLLCAARSQHALAAVDGATLAEQYLLSAANQERTARGLPVLRRDPRLAQAAAGHAREMVAHTAISHQFPGEAELTSRGAHVGVPFSLISENVAEAPNVVQIQAMWMRSEHHRANLLDPAIDSAGISVIARGGELYAVEDFARSVPSISLEEQESAISAILAETWQIALENDPREIAAARQTCAMATGFAGLRRPWFVMRFTAADLTQLPNQLRARLDSGRYHGAAVGACFDNAQSAFTAYNFAVLLYP